MALSLTRVTLEPELRSYGRKVTSQNDEDGILAYLVSALGLTEGFCVEFGIGPPWQGDLARDGLEGNCRQLLEHGWRGLLMDAALYPPEYGVHQEFVSAFNVNELLRKHQTPESIDVMSLDVDGQEFWIWCNLMARPRIIVVEYNGAIPADVSATVPFDLMFKWDGTNYHGASLAALQKLGRSKFYTLVYANGVNAFFVCDDLVANPAAFSLDRVYVGLELHPPDPAGRPWVRI
jgi:hypothetical protein